MIYDYLIHLGIMACIYIILTMAFNISLGFTGLVNLGHIALFGIGAYISSLLTLNDVPIVLSILTAMIGSSLIGMLLALPTKKIKGDYLALVTLGFTFIAMSVSRNWISLTRGALGLPGIPKLFSLPLHYLIFYALLVAIIYVALKLITKSNLGRVMQAVRDDETAAMALGKNTYAYKIMAFGISGLFAGLAGALFAHYLTFIDPTIFFLGDLVLMLSMLVVGGLASLEGSVVGALIIFLLPEPLRFIGFSPALVGPFRDVLFALFLILILIYRPRGILGRIDLP